MKTKYDKSIRYKLLLVVALLFIGYVISVEIVNRLYLEDYYARQLEYEIESSLDNELIDMIEPNEEGLDFFIKLSIETGYKYTITNHQGEALLVTVPEFQLDNPIDLEGGLLEFVRNNSLHMKPGDTKYTTVKFDNSEVNNVIYLKALKNGYFLIVREEFEVFQETTRVAIRFFLIVRIALLGVTLVIVYFLTKRIVKPIISLSHLAEDIAELNFSNRYTGKRDDEIGILGYKMNEISIKLKRQINELQSANEQLGEDMRLQKRFLASVSHEFKSPVGIIKGYSESIKMKLYQDEEEKEDFLDYIIEEADYLSDLVGDVILLAKLGQRNYELSLVEADISILFEEVISKYNKKINEEGITLKTDIHPKVMTQIDKTRMKQVFVNILDNAYFYNIEGGDIFISLRKEKDKVELIVENSCKPIEDKEMDLLFNPFYRIEKSQNQTTGGQGLGLAITKGIIELHQGRIKLQCDGGRFKVLIEV